MEFIKKINDLYNRSENKNILTYTNFLTQTERELIKNNISGKKLFFSGGIENCERVRAFFLPEYIDNLDVSQYITLYKVTFSFKKLTHRDFLGAILALGIKRECIGDIYVFEKEAYFFVTREMTDFIKNNLIKVGAVGVELMQINFNEIKIPEKSFCEVKFTVQSLRLDSVIAGIFKESREKMNLKIREGVVLLNYVVCQNTNEKINVGDIISVRGFGKAKIYNIGGKSRSGKTFVEAQIYR